MKAFTIATRIFTVQVNDASDGRLYGRVELPIHHHHQQQQQQQQQQQTLVVVDVEQDQKDRAQLHDD